MKKTLIALATLSALTGVANAEGLANTTIYGTMDVAVRTLSNQTADGGRLNTIGSGLLTTNFIGFKGAEDLGNGLKAIYQLEAGFDIGNGSSNSNTLFGRTALLGLSDSTYGTLTFGRQTNLGFDFANDTSVYGNSAGDVLSGNQRGLSGSRWSNSVKYVNKIGAFNVGAQIASGNTAGSTSNNSAYAIAGGYDFGDLNLQAVYQKSNDTMDGVLGSLPNEKQTYSAIGATYDLGNTKLYGQYFHNKYDVSSEVNDIYVAGAAYKLTQRVTLTGSVTYDNQKSVNAGHRNTYTSLVSYSFSKSTDVYAELDYTKLNGAYSNSVYDYNSVANPNATSTGMSLGMRHSF
jgi:predicted porin